MLAAGYPLLVLSWLPGGLTGRARAIGWGLLGLWSALVLAALLVSSIASILVPEVAAPTEAALASVLLLWPLAVGLDILRDRRGPGMLASAPAFR